MRAGFCYEDADGLHCVCWWDRERCCHCHESKVQSLGRQTSDEFSHRPTVKHGSC
jgi:hypothetical protein